MSKSTDFSVGATGPFVITGTHDGPLRYHYCSDHGIRSSRSPASSPQPEGLSHEMDVLIDVIHLLACLFPGRARAFGLDCDGVTATRRLRVLGFAEAFTAFFFCFVAGFCSSAFNAA